MRTLKVFDPETLKWVVKAARPLKGWPNDPRFAIWDGVLMASNAVMLHAVNQRECSAAVVEDPGEELWVLELPKGTKPAEVVAHEPLPGELKLYQSFRKIVKGYWNLLGHSDWVVDFKREDLPPLTGPWSIKAWQLLRKAGCPFNLEALSRTISVPGKACLCREEEVLRRYIPLGTGGLSVLLFEGGRYMALVMPIQA